ncbi:MAG: hypothetical protein NVS9B7_11180 [Flavisolibacter sp.]
MMHFAKKVTSPTGHANLYFNRIYTAKGLHYHISYVNHAKKAQVFDMEERNGDWILINLDKVPSWIIKIEKDLSDYINRNASLHSL